MGKSGVGASSIIPNKDKNQIFQEERVEPCHLSSSLYYGGQDIYSNSSSTQTSGSYPVVSLNQFIHAHNMTDNQYDNSRGFDIVTKCFAVFFKKQFKKDEDDPNGNNSQGASRGNWWQGMIILSEDKIATQ